MKNAFYNNCGESVDLFSDIGARFQAVASELYSLACYEDFVLKQAFLQTATGQYLDYHAQLRSKERKSATKAFGILTFSINEPLANNIEIPAGTICAIKEQPFIQFETTHSVTLVAGETFVDAPAMALDFGKSFNAKAGEITTMVNPPSGIAFVTNHDSFIGGADEESDEALRKRLLTSYSVAQNGVTLNSIAEAIEKIPEILDCRVYYDNDCFSAFVKTATNTLDYELKDRVLDAMMLASIVNKDAEAYCATPKGIKIKAVCKAKQTERDVLREEIKKAFVNCFDSLAIGDGVSVDKLVRSISRLDGIEYAEIFSPNAIGGYISAQEGEYLRLDETEVVLYD